MPWVYRLMLGMALAAAQCRVALAQHTETTSVGGTYVNLGDGLPPPLQKTPPALDLDHADRLRMDTGAAAETSFGLRATGFLRMVPSQAQAADAAHVYLVFFDWDRADLTPRARGVVAEAAISAARIPMTQIEVDGYTDLSGSVAYNKRLSVRRAQNVAAELVRDGVPADEIEMRGLGDGRAAEKPIRKERVEIVLK